MKVFLAGTFGEIENQDVIMTSKYNLESFYYIKPWQYKLIEHSEMFLLDSGAFTFFSSGRSINWDEYITKYTRFINEHDIKYYFELDIDILVGYESVLKIRRQLEEKTGKKCIPVWHKHRGIEEFKRMCDEYNYVAIGGIASREIKQNQHRAFPTLISEAHKRGAKIHGLGYTNVQKFERNKFDSVDSTRWKCARFGRIEYFDGTTIRAIDKRKEGKRLLDHSKITKITIQEWIKFQKYAEKNL